MKLGLIYMQYMNGPYSAYGSCYYKSRPRKHSQLYSDIKLNRATPWCCNASCWRRFPTILLPAMHKLQKCWEWWMGKLKRTFWYYRLIGEWSRSGHRQNHWYMNSSKTSVNFFAMNSLVSTGFRHDVARCFLKTGIM